MIETLMKQLYFRGLRRRVEHLVAQRRETSPSEVYLYWIDGGDGNDPWMAIGPNGEEWYRGDPGPIPGIETSAGREASSPANPTPITAMRASGSPAPADHDETSSSAGKGFPASMENLWERGRRFPREPLRCRSPRLAPHLRSAGPASPLRRKRNHRNSRRHSTGALPAHCTPHCTPLIETAMSLAPHPPHGSAA